MVWGVVATAVVAETVTTGPGTLVYKDGDRVNGEVIERTASEIVFKSERFGLLRVPVADAVVIPAEKPAVAASRAKPAAQTAAQTAAPAVARIEKAAARGPEERAEEERISAWEWFSPSQLTARVRNYFGPWHGRLAVSTEVVSDSARRNNDSFDSHLSRKWERDDVQLAARYDYAEANQIATTDTLKASATWRHDFNPREFAQYRPSVEWNRASKLKGVPNDYVLLQQEVGAGLNLFARPGRKVRVGASENLFDVWNTTVNASHGSHAVVSLFDETEWTLPWRMTLTQRGVWYPVRNKVDGWEHRVELNKKLTETLSVALRHEIRRNNPDGSSQDYTRLKMLLGFDF